MARPKKSPEDLRDVRTAVMLTERERVELEQRASTYGLSLSDFIRRQTLGRPVPASVAEQKTRATLATALLRLGVNLNQITRHMASRHESSASVRHFRTYGDQAASMDVSRRSGLRSRLSVGVQM